MDIPLVIFLMGKAQSGKDTVGDYLTEEIEYRHNGEYPVASLAFADTLKNICERNFGYRDKKEDRDILIKVGDEMRAIDSEAFVKPVAFYIQILRQMGYKVFIITDLRFENEFDQMIEMIDCLPFVIKVQSKYEHQNVSAFAKNHPTENLEFTPDYSLVMPPLTKETMPEVEKELDNLLKIIFEKYLTELEL